MQYSRAGLFALLFTLIISLVSAFPIPESISPTLSSRSTPNLNGQDRPIELDTGARTRNLDILLRGRMSTLPLATKLNRRQFPTDTDEQLVRRNKIGDKKTHASQNIVGHKIKSGYQKAGTAIKKVARTILNHIHAKISSKLQKKIIAAKNEAHDMASLGKKKKKKKKRFPTSKSGI